MGTIFEELIRRFNEEDNEEVGEHIVPRDAVHIVAPTVVLPMTDEVEDGTELLYDGTCGIGGKPTEAEEVLQHLGKERGRQASTDRFGQEINAETCPICEGDLLLKGEGEAATNIVGGQEHSTLSNDAFLNVGRGERYTSDPKRNREALADGARWGQEKPTNER